MWVEGPVNSVGESSSVNEHILALIHYPCYVSLRVAVELDDSSVPGLFSCLSSHAVLKITDIAFKFFNIGSVGAGLPVVLSDVFSVVGNSAGIFLDLFLGPLNSLDKLLEDDSSGLNRNDLVRVNVYLMGVALIINGWLVDVEIVDGIAETLWSDWASVAVVVTRVVMSVVVLFSRGGEND